MNTISEDSISPPFNQEGWALAGTYKIELVNGDVWTTIPKDHWLRPVCSGGAFIKSGFYADPGHPEELARVIGFAPEYGAYLFRKKEVKA